MASAQAERDALARQLSAAQASSAKVEGQTISQSGEFAAVQFVAAALDTDQDTVARALIIVVAALPDCLAALLIVTVGYVAPRAPRAPATRPARKRKASRRRVTGPVELKVLEAR